MGVLEPGRAGVIPAHWIWQVITSVILETAKYTPTWEISVSGAKVGRCWLFRDHAQKACVGGEQGLQEDWVLSSRIIQT